MIVFLLSRFDLSLFAQKSFIGNYGLDKSNKEIYLTLKNDFTFTYGWRGHMWKDTSSGQYTVNADTIFLTFRSPVLLPEALSAVNRPDTLVSKKSRLYRIENGELIDKTKKSKASFIKTGDWRKWYRKKYYLFGSYISKRKRIYYLDKFK